MSDDARQSRRIYRDERYCCLDCGCDHFEAVEGPRDRCNSCGSLRDTKRGPKDSVKA